MANTINIKKYAKPKETTNVSQSGYANSVTRIINQTATGGVAAAFEPHYLWGQYFDDTRDISGDMTDVGNINATGNISTTANITAGGTITGNRVVANTADIGTLDADAITADDATITSILSNYIHNTGDIVNDNMITTKDLTVTGTAHFFELIIDKIKASGGAAIFTPADGFRIEDDTCIIPVQDGYVITFYTTDGQRAIRNMWQVGDQAICRSFNEAHVGTSYNVKNKYYWTLVTQAGTLAAGDTITDRNGDTVQFEEDRHFIRISTQSGVDADGRAYYDGTVDPEVGDEIAMLGYRGTDDPNRQSAIYISAYSSMDADIRAPFIAHYKGINDFQLSSHRKTWFAANSSQITGALKIQTTDGDVDVQTAIENGRQYIHTAYCRTENNSDNSFSRTYFADAVYMGTAYTSTADESSLTFADYAPWVRIRGVDGRNGTDGAGITTVEEWYYANSSTTQPKFNQSTWTKDAIPSNYNTTNKYLWNVEIIVYSTGERAEPTTPQMIGVYGKDGRGIRSITEYYKKSNKISNESYSGDWQETVPTVDATNRYLWNYEVITFTDDSTPHRTPPALIGMYAEDGRSVEQITEWYTVTTSDAAPEFSTSTWTRDSVPAMDETNAYLWNVEEIQYNDTVEYTGVALIGHFGADGRGIQLVTEYYAVHTSMDTAPQTGWQTSVPTMNATYKYLWNYERITYTDGDTQDTEPALIGVYSVGEDGKYTQFVFAYSDKQPYTPIGQTIPPSGPDGTKWYTTVTTNSSGGSSDSGSTTLNPLSVTSLAPSGKPYKFIYDSSTQTWHSPSTPDNGKRTDTFQFTLSRATTVTVRLRASCESYDYGAAGKLDDETLASQTLDTVKAQATGGENVMRAVSGTNTADITYNCSAGTHKIQIGYFKDQSVGTNDDCVYVQFFVADSSASTPVDTTQQLWMSFAVVDKGIVSPWSTPIPMGGKDGRDGTDGRDGRDGTDGRDAIAYYLSQSSGTFTYSGNSYSPSSVTLYLVRSDGHSPRVFKQGLIKDGITERYGCTVSASESSTSIAYTITPEEKSSGGYFEVTCMNDDNSVWGVLRYSYNLITKSFVSEIVDDQMTNYATKTEVNSLGQTVQSNSSWIQQNSEKVASAVTAQDLSGYVTESELTQTATQIETSVKSSISSSSTNLIMNGNFSKGTSTEPAYWTKYGSPSSYGVINTGSNYGAVTINNKWQGFYQYHYNDYGITINGGQTYTLSFKARATRNNEQIQICIHLWNDTLAYKTYGGYSRPQINIYKTLTTTATTYSHTFVVKQDSHALDGNNLCVCRYSGSNYTSDDSWYISTGAPASSFEIMFMSSANTTSGTSIQITDIMLVPGSAAQSWAPSAEELSEASTETKITQTADSITTRVNDVSTRLDSGGFTINANTTINGQLSINNTEEQGFIIVGDNGNTSILSKTIGTYNAFKNTATKWIKVEGSIKHAYWSTSSNSYNTGSNNKSIGYVTSGTILKFRGFSCSTHKSETGDNYIPGSWSGTIQIYNGTSLVKTFSNVSSRTGEQSYTTTSSGTYSYKLSWTVNSLVNTSGQSVSSATIDTTFAMFAFIPSATYTLIGYDGIASNFSNDNTVFFGNEGTYIRYTDNNVLRVSANGIEKHCNGTTGGGNDYYVSEWSPINGCCVRKIGASGNYSLRSFDDMIVVNFTGDGTASIYLGIPSNNKGRKIYIKTMQGNCRVYGYASGGSGSYLIPNDDVYATTYRAQNERVRIYISDGTYWYEGYF